ncbi:hypothetical protein CRUP_009778 [Coryphaenoides rupestris]|nr:hypothetical protein CRUP_009778 [Coryphaenoides rupestris]
MELHLGKVSDGFSLNSTDSVAKVLHLAVPVLHRCGPVNASPYVILSERGFSSILYHRAPALYECGGNRRYKMKKRSVDANRLRKMKKIKLTEKLSER